MLVAHVLVPLVGLLVHFLHAADLERAVMHLPEVLIVKLDAEHEALSVHTEPGAAALVIQRDLRVHTGILIEELRRIVRIEAEVEAIRVARAGIGIEARLRRAALVLVKPHHIARKRVALPEHVRLKRRCDGGSIDLGDHFDVHDPVGRLGQAEVAAPRAVVEVEVRDHAVGRDEGRHDMLAVHDGQQLRARVILIDAVDRILLAIFNASDPERSLGPVVLLDADGHAAILIIDEHRVVEAEVQITTLRVDRIQGLPRLACIFKLVFPVLSGENTIRSSIILIDRLHWPELGAVETAARHHMERHRDHELAVVVEVHREGRRDVVVREGLHAVLHELGVDALALGLARAAVIIGIVHVAHGLVKLVGGGPADHAKKCGLGSFAALYLEGRRRLVIVVLVGLGRHTADQQLRELLRGHARAVREVQVVRVVLGIIVEITALREDEAQRVAVQVAVVVDLDPANVVVRLLARHILASRRNRLVDFLRARAVGADLRHMIGNLGPIRRAVAHLALEGVAVLHERLQQLLLRILVERLEVDVLRKRRGRCVRALHLRRGAAGRLCTRLRRLLPAARQEREQKQCAEEAQPQHPTGRELLIYSSMHHTPPFQTRMTDTTKWLEIYSIPSHPPLFKSRTPAGGPGAARHLLSTINLS